MVKNKEDLLERDVFVSGTEGYHTYRIPSLITTKKGTLLAFCEGRKNNRNDHGDIDLMLKRSMDGGKTWGGLEMVYEEGGTAEITIGNPCPVVDEQTGTIWLTLCRDNRDVLVTGSTDDGVTWSRPVDITKDVKKPDWRWYATGPGVGIQLRSGRHQGRLVIPCDHGETIDDGLPKYSHVFYSDDHGASWKLGGSVSPHTDECQLVELHDGTVLINMRNYFGSTGKRPDLGNMRAIARSRDGGQTWGDLNFDRTLIEPVCQASLLRATDPTGNALFLFSNPGSTKRVNMTVRMSRDEGRSWPVARSLHAGPSAYSCLSALPDGSIGCLYERGREYAYETITFAMFPIDWLRSGS